MRSRYTRIGSIGVVSRHIHQVPIIIVVCAFVHPAILALAVYGDKSTTQGAPSQNTAQPYCHIDKDICEQWTPALYVLPTAVFGTIVVAMITVCIYYGKRRAVAPDSLAPPAAVAPDSLAPPAAVALDSPPPTTLVAPDSPLPTTPVALDSPPPTTPVALDFHPPTTPVDPDSPPPTTPVAPDPSIPTIPMAPDSPLPTTPDPSPPTTPDPSLRTASDTPLPNLVPDIYRQPGPLEQRIFRENFAVLATGIQGDLTSFANELLAKCLISSNVKEKALNEAVDIATRASGLLSTLEKRIQTDSSAFADIVKIVESNPSLSYLAQKFSPPSYLKMREGRAVPLDVTSSQGKMKRQERVGSVPTISSGSSHIPPVQEFSDSVESPEDRFKHLSTSHLNPRGKDDLIAQLIFDRRRIQSRFQSLLNKSKEAFKDVPIERLATHIQAMEGICYSREHDSCFENDFKKVGNAPNIYKVFLILRPYISFFNFDLLERMIDGQQNEYLQSQLQEYKEVFEEYCKRKVTESSSLFSSTRSNNQREVTMKIGALMEETSLYKVHLLQKEIGRIINVPLTLHKIDEGCMMLTFLIPSFMEDKIFPMSEEQLQNLAAIGVMKVECGDYSQETGVSSTQQTLENAPSTPDSCLPPTSMSPDSSSSLIAVPPPVTPDLPPPPTAVIPDSPPPMTAADEEDLQVQTASSTSQKQQILVFQAQIDHFFKNNNITPQYEYVQDHTIYPPRYRCRLRYVRFGTSMCFQSDGYFLSKDEAKVSAGRKVLQAEESQALVSRGPSRSQKTLSQSMGSVQKLAEYFQERGQCYVIKYRRKEFKQGYQFNVFVPDIGYAEGDICGSLSEAKESAAARALEKLFK